MTCIFSGKHCLCKECREMRYAEGAEHLRQNLEFIAQCVWGKEDLGENQKNDRVKRLENKIERLDKSIQFRDHKSTELKHELVRGFTDSDKEIIKRVEALEASSGNLKPMAIGAVLALAGVLFFSVISGVMGG